MEIKDLPDDCLINIFEYINLLEELVQLSGVCVKWYYLIKMRISKVKYLLSSEFDTDDPKRTLKMENMRVVVECDLNHYLPNLEILDLGFYEFGFSCSEFLYILNGNPKIKGLIEPPAIPPNYAPPVLFVNLKMLAKLHDPGFNEFYYPQSLRQLVLFDCELITAREYFKFFRNLTKLSLMECNPKTNDFYRGPSLMHLKILQFSAHEAEPNRLFPGYHFMDHCPALESAYFRTVTNEFFVDESVRNYNIRNLVIEHKDGTNQNWGSLRCLLKKFPNLQHFALRRNDYINDDNVKELIALLPDIELMDFRLSPNVTQKSAEYVKNIRMKSGRRIEIYHYCGAEIERQPPSWCKYGYSRAIVCIGFDFMKNCFFRRWKDLPWFLNN